MVNTTTAELNDTYDQLTLEGGVEIFGKKINGAYLQPIALEQAAQSGHFSSGITEDMMKLSRDIRAYDMYLTFLLGAISNGNLQAVNLAIANLNEAKKVILQNIPAVREKINQPNVSS